MKTMAYSLLLAVALSANAYAGSNEVDTPVISTIQQTATPVTRTEVEREMKEHPAQQASNEIGQSVNVRASGNAAGGQVKK